VWKGTKKGQKSEGEVSGNNPTLLKTQLRRQGIVVTNFKRKPQPLFGGGGKKITNADIAIFTRQMATMLRAGVPLVQALGMVAEGLKHPNLEKLVKEIEEEVASGTPFASALMKHPEHFDNLYCSLI
ncbi:MAG: type II secretion system F family protein, partial [Pseudomonadales bacterium]